MSKQPEEVHKDCTIHVVSGFTGGYTTMHCPRLNVNFKIPNRLKPENKSIDELGGVKLNYGNHEAETYINGKPQSIPDRLAELKEEQ